MSNRCHAITETRTRCKLKIAGNNHGTLCHKHLRITMDGRTHINLVKNPDDDYDDDYVYDVPMHVPIHAPIPAQIPMLAPRYQQHQRVPRQINNNNCDGNGDHDDFQVNYAYDMILDDMLDDSVYESLEQKYLQPNIVVIKPEILIPLDPTQNYECQCCFTEYSFDELIKCSNASTKYKHVYCNDCIKGYIESGMNDKNVSYQCMSDTKNENCKGCYKNSDIEKCLSEKMYKIFSDMIIVSEITSFAKLFNNYKICPFCNMFGIIVEGNDIQYVKCERCVDKSWCILCKREAHDKDPCWKIKNANDRDAIVYAVTETITNALAHKCPNCNTEYIKEEGCNLITCSACHSYSCYLCGISIKPIAGDKYWHFYGEGGTPTNIKTCQLFNGYGEKQGNTKYNNDKILKACETLLKANDLEIQNIMKIEMKKHGIQIDNSNIVKKRNLYNHICDNMCIMS